MESWATTTTSCRGASRGTSSRTGTGSTGGTSAASAAWTSSASRRPSSSRCSRKSCSRVSEYAAARVSKLRCCAPAAQSVEERPRLGCVSLPRGAGANARNPIFKQARRTTHVNEDDNVTCKSPLAHGAIVCHFGERHPYKRNWRREPTESCTHDDDNKDKNGTARSRKLPLKSLREGRERDKQKSQST